MASVEVTISGVLFDKNDRTSQNVVLIGEATLTGVGIGGGPIFPPPGGGGDVNPPGIWGGGNLPFPTPPIANAPGIPPSIDLPPPSIWPPGPGIDLPSHPIVLPPGTDHIPDGPIDWKPVWTPDTGWVVVGFPNVPHPAPSQANPRRK